MQTNIQTNADRVSAQVSAKRWRDTPPMVHFTPRSSNMKIGPMPASLTGWSSCPDECPLKARGCYAKTGPLGWHADKVSRADRGITWAEFLENVEKINPGTVWRHNQSGDLPGENNVISAELLRSLVAANEGRRGFTYTHKPVLDGQDGPVKANRREIENANRKGFTVNLSANGLNHADKLAALNIGPVVTILPAGVESNTVTPKGRRVVVCPAQIKEGVTCSTCKLCSRGDRSVIVGFIPHGASKKHVGNVAKVNS